MENTRDYNKELLDNAGRKYAYSFDLDVLHKYMMRLFLPFFRTGKCLELGSYTGCFTRRLLEYFKDADLECVEASSDAIRDSELSSRIKIHNSTFEELSLPNKYDNVILTHVLEHIDDPVSLLKKINNEWLTDDGLLFIACPNANAPSRQIAVNMGLIAHNHAVTDAEAKHGHRRTYSMDTMQQDVRSANLEIVHSSGVFFKALANFQWDKIICAGIVNDEYLDGCYQLGLLYPDLCASIVIICKRK